VKDGGEKGVEEDERRMRRRSRRLRSIYQNHLWPKRSNTDVSVSDIIGGRGMNWMWFEEIAATQPLKPEQNPMGYVVS
jgi:hypothetical protein